MSTPAAQSTPLPPADRSDRWWEDLAGGRNRLRGRAQIGRAHV